MSDDTEPAGLTDLERIQMLERMVFLMLAIINGELGKETWNHQLHELFELQGRQAVQTALES